MKSKLNPTYKGLPIIIFKDIANWNKLRHYLSKEFS